MSPPTFWTRHVVLPYHILSSFPYRILSEAYPLGRTTGSW